MRCVNAASARLLADGIRPAHAWYPLGETPSTWHVIETPYSARLLFTNPKTSRVIRRSPEQTRPRLLPESPARASAAGSHGAAARAPPPRRSSTRRCVVLRPDPSGRPSSGSPAPMAQTLAPAPPGYVPTEPAPPSVAETPPRMAHDSLASSTPFPQV